MSSEAKAAPRDTRRVLLEACWKLIEEGGVPTLEAVATAAGVSRQALYLHFKNRNDLLVQCLEHMKQQHGTSDVLARVATAPDCETALDIALAFHAEFTPRIARASRLFAVELERDTELASAWEARTTSRLHHARALVDRIVADDRLAAGWTRDDAADLLWTLLSPATTDDLTSRRRWSRKRLAERLRSTIHATLLTPRRPP